MVNFGLKRLLLCEIFVVSLHFDMRRHFLLTIGLSIALLGACAPKPEASGSGDREALAQYMETYPKAQLRDIYKSCFQDVFGVAHLISDTQACVRYLENEMKVMDDQLEVLDERFTVTVINGCRMLDYEYTLPDSHFVRVDLHVVADGRVPQDLLVDVLMESAATPPYMTQEEWVARWQEIKSAAETLVPRPHGFEEDAAAIDSLLAEGDYVMHHSLRYNEVYNPHYRLIRRDLFEQHILPLL